MNGLVYKKKSIILLILSYVLTLFLFRIETYAYTGNGDTIVHITQTGDCYHSEGCFHLKSDIKVSLEEAIIKGLVPCTDCNPPIYTGDAKPEVSPTPQHHNSGGHSGGGSGTVTPQYQLSQEHFLDLDTSGIYSTAVVIADGVYHRKECPIIHNNSKRETLIEAVESGMDRCYYCNPPVLTKEAIQYYELYLNTDDAVFLNYKVIETGNTFHRIGCIEIDNDISSTISLFKARMSGLDACVYCNPPKLHMGRYMLGLMGIFVVWKIVQGLFISAHKKEIPTLPVTDVNTVNNQTGNGKAESQKNIQYAYRTPKGNCFHLSQECEALKNSRNVIRYPLERARTEWRRPCSLCAKAERGMYIAKTRKR